MGKRRLPFGAALALLVAALGFGARRADPEGLGKDPVVKGSSRLIASGGVIWMLWAAAKAFLERRPRA